MRRNLPDKNHVRRQGTMLAMKLSMKVLCGLAVVWLIAAVRDANRTRRVTARYNVWPGGGGSRLR